MKNIFVTALMAAVVCAGANAQTTPSESVLPRLAKVLNLIDSKYVKPVDEGKLFTDAVNGLLKGLDPYSTYLDPEAYRKLQQDVQGKYGGLGIEMRKDGGFFRVVSVIEDTPAHRAGLMPGDLITRLDDSSTTDMTLEQAVRHTRGTPNTTLTLTFLREGDSTPRVLELEREQIKDPSVRAGLIAPRTAYLRLSQFHRRTPEEMALALEKLSQSTPGGVTGIVLDLRDNLGGNLIAAVAVAGAFLSNGTLVVYTEGLSEDSKRKYPVRAHLGPKNTETIPLVVLVNQRSASASEIVAGALQDHRRAIVLGTRTYGKGSIQTILPLGDGAAVKLTTAHYFTPNGRSIDKQGVTPDQIVEQAPPGGSEASAQSIARGHLAFESEGDSASSRIVCGLDPSAHPSATAPAMPQEPDLIDCQLHRALQALTRQSVSRAP
ncbi:MAG: S41 family peptidase [Burkholderiales bacterium]